MLVVTLTTLMDLKRLKPAELAKKAGITRQAISQWFKIAESHHSVQINAEWNTILKIADALHVKPEALSKDYFQSLTPEKKHQYQSLLLWDHLYESIESFSIALTKKEYRAVGRYVQVFGILAAEKIYGAWIFKKFEQYSLFIHPIRRKELGKLCQTFRELNLI